MKAGKLAYDDNQWSNGQRQSYGQKSWFEYKS
jgi:hypothetical protein